MIHWLSDVREVYTSTVTVVEAFNNGDIRTSESMTYTMAGSNRYFGKEAEVDLLHPNGDFSRSLVWEYDFNQDGLVSFKGKALERGRRTLQGETFWRYSDEANAQSEGGDNGETPRHFDDLDLAAQIDARDLTGVDIIQSITITSEVVDTTDTITKSVKQYPAEWF